MAVNWPMPVHPDRADVRVALCCRRRIELAACPPAGSSLPGRQRPVTTTRVDGLGRARLPLGDDGALSLRLPADNQVSPWDRRRTGPGGLSSTEYQPGASTAGAHMKERS
jgi:hypothetical protein